MTGNTTNNLIKIEKLIVEAGEILYPINYILQAQQYNKDNISTEIEIEEVRKLYQKWYEKCLALIPDDLKENFEDEYTGKNKIKKFLTDIGDIKSGRNYEFIQSLDTQTQILKTIQKRHPIPPSALDKEFKGIVAHALRNSTTDTIDNIFTNNGCEPQWWIQLKKESNKIRVNRVYGWFAGILIHAPEKERMIAKGVCNELINRKSIKPSYREIIKKELEILLTNTPEMNPLDLYKLHSKVKEVASPLFVNGHYREAVLNVYVALIEATKAKAERLDLDGSSLMNHVFSPNTPVLKVSDNKDEQQGFMLLFNGAVMAIRNPNAHSVEIGINDEDALELLVFASLLFKTLDGAKKV